MGRIRRRGGDGAEELNVTPLMNLFVAIVPLLLMSAIFATVASIDLGAPTVSALPQRADDFVLALRVTTQEWRVEARDEPSVRVDPGDTEGLLQALEALQARHPEHASALVACADAVPYADVVRVLDAAAVAGFPDCALVGLDARAGGAASTEGGS